MTVFNPLEAYVVQDKSSLVCVPCTGQSHNQWGEVAGKPSWNQGKV